jgi:hypothetical protein
MDTRPYRQQQVAFVVFKVLYGEGVCMYPFPLLSVSVSSISSMR